MRENGEKGFINIQSSELFFLENELADVGSRAYAYLIDLTIRGCVIIGILVLYFLNKSWNLFAETPIVLIGIAWFIGYHLVFEVLFNGVTPGKKAAGIRVIKSDGSSLSLLDSAIRNLMRVVDSLPFGYFLSIAIILFEQYNRRLGDILADTIVIHDRSKNQGITHFLDEILIESKPRETVLMSGIDTLSENDRLVIRNLYQRFNQMAEGKEKRALIEKFMDKITTRITITGTTDPEIILCELYKRI